MNNILIHFLTVDKYWVCFSAAAWYYWDLCLSFDVASLIKNWYKLCNNLGFVGNLRAKSFFQPRLKPQIFVQTSSNFCELVARLTFSSANCQEVSNYISNNVWCFTVPLFLSVKYEKMLLCNFSFYHLNLRACKNNMFQTNCCLYNVEMCVTVRVIRKWTCNAKGKWLQHDFFIRNTLSEIVLEN